MLSFKQYLLKEFGDINTILSSNNDVELEESPDGYEYIFGRHKIYMDKSSMRLTTGEYPFYEYHDILDRNVCYAIGLTHNGDYYQTNQGNEFNVYSVVFKAMKKFLKLANPAGLKFSGYSPEMDLLYHKFYNKFLASTFMKIDDENYIRKTVYETLPEDLKKIVQLRMGREDYDQNLQIKRADKIKWRQEKLKQMGKTYQVPNLQQSKPDDDDDDLDLKDDWAR